MACGLSGGDDPNRLFILPLDVHDYGDDVLEKAHTCPSVFSAVLASIQLYQHGMAEHVDHVSKIDAVLSSIIPVLLLIPYKTHITSVYTKCNDVKGETDSGGRKNGTW
jgi:hypothetical protein